MILYDFVGRALALLACPDPDGCARLDASVAAHPWLWALAVAALLAVAGHLEVV